MSHYTELKVQMKAEHADCLIEALLEMKPNWLSEDIEVNHSTTMPLRGFEGDTRKQRANIRIKGHGWGAANRVGAASNDLGFEFRKDGSIIAHVSEYDKREGYDAKWFAKLSQCYAVRVARKTAPAGYQISEARDDAGNVVLTMLKA